MKGCKDRGGCESKGYGWWIDWKVGKGVGRIWFGGGGWVFIEDGDRSMVRETGSAVFLLVCARRCSNAILSNDDDNIVQMKHGMFSEVSAPEKH